MASGSGDEELHRVLVGSVFSREALTAPRRPRFYAVRVLFVAALLGLALTAWQMLVGAQELAGPGDLARFGAAVFALISPLTLTVCVLFSALLAAAAVCQEKDRKTLILLLLSDLTNSELVLGKLLASMLTVLVVIASAVPFFLALTLLGGVSYLQVANVLAVTLVSSLAAGSLGSLLALWREKTFQALALVSLAIVLWLVAWEIVASGAVGAVCLGLPCGDLAAMASPWRAIQAAIEPTLAGEATALVGITSGALTPASLVSRFLGGGIAIVVALNALAITMIRVWNPSREARPRSAEEEEAAIAGDVVTDQERFEAHRAPGKARNVWENPVLWREVRTWAYGKKILVIKLAYVVIFALCAVAALQAANERGSIIPPAAGPIAPLLVVSVVLVNALSVTSLTNERDGKALDLLLATDLTPKELIFGKLGGAFWNAKEMVLLPLALLAWLWGAGGLSGESLLYLSIGLLVVNLFAAVLGLHSGMIYANSRQAIGASVGTLLFLFLGVSTCMRMMLELSDSFEQQLVPFMGFMLGGGVVLFAALGWRNPSTAMGLACFPAPFVTFYAITSFLLGSYDLAFGATIVTFGFATAAMLVPALSEFDVATGGAGEKG